MRYFISIFVFAQLLILISCGTREKIRTTETAPWSSEKAWEWYDNQPWYVGSNFIPSDAINQLEMWQESTFNPELIRKELGWASGIGFNIMRVYLHNLLWEDDAEGLKQRMDQYLSIADSLGIKTMFVLFDDCWYGNAQLGEQPDPVPGLHNSYWLQSPRYAEVMDESKHPDLKAYVIDILTHFSQDERVVVWDLYNEPANNHQPHQIFPLVKKVFAWAREANPNQPVTMGAWRTNSAEMVELTDYQLNHSDIVTFHAYGSLENLRKKIANYGSFGRPLICTEYLARGFNSLFETHLPVMKKHKVGAINWGLVFGKTQTVYPWNTPLNSPVPEVWHHDIFWPDGTPYSQMEIDTIKALTGR